MYDSLTSYMYNTLYVHVQASYITTDSMYLHMITSIKAKKRKIQFFNKPPTYLICSARNSSDHPDKGA